MPDILDQPGAPLLDQAGAPLLDQAPTPAPMVDAAGAADSLVSPGTGNTAGAAESMTVSAATGSVPDAAGAVESLATSETLQITLQVTVTPGVPSPALDEAGNPVDDEAGNPILDEYSGQPQEGPEAAGAVEMLQVVQLPVGAPTPNPVPLKLASPAFIRSQMPRMHVQNLLTGQWLHRDVQGITSPNVTWNLNQPDTFTATLAPPRRDMLDSTGNPVLRVWRDAVYLEEADTIRWGGILTSMTANGPQLQLGATGFAGYPAGIPYDGPSITEYNVDALDMVRYLWAYVQSQPNGNLGLQLDTTKAGVLLGSHVTNLASSFLSQSSYPVNEVLIPKPQVIPGHSPIGYTVYQQLWFTNAAAFSAGMDIVIGGTEQTRIVQVVTNANNVATGAVIVIPLSNLHSAGEEILQVQTHTTLARDAASGQNTIWTYNSQGFSNGEVILIGTVPYTVQTVFTNTTTGLATGQIALTHNLTENHKTGDLVVQAPTPFQLLWWNSTDCGQEISSIQAEAPFDYRETHTWTSPAREDVIHRLLFGVPRIGIRQDRLRFAEGENIIQAGTVTSDGTTFADTVVGLGAGQGASQIRSVVSQLSGRLRRVQVYSDQTVTTTARMSSKARRVLTATLAQLDNPTQIVVKNHPNAPFGSFSVGDDIYIQLFSGWRNGKFWVRITSMSQDPSTDLATLTIARSDSFTYLAQSGQAGSI